MRAVADSSVLIALSAIGQLALLPRRFPRGVAVPPAVWREVVEVGQGQPGAAEVASAAWVTMVQVQDEPLVALLSMELDQGEAEAIAVGCEDRDSVVLLDRYTRLAGRAWPVRLHGDLRL